MDQEDVQSALADIRAGKSDRQTELDWGVSEDYFKNELRAAFFIKSLMKYIRGFVQFRSNDLRTGFLLKRP